MSFSHSSCCFLWHRSIVFLNFWLLSLNLCVISFFCNMSLFLWTFLTFCPPVFYGCGHSRELRRINKELAQRRQTLADDTRIMQMTIVHRSDVYLLCAYEQHIGKYMVSDFSLKVFNRIAFLVLSLNDYNYRAGNAANRHRRTWKFNDHIYLDRLISTISSVKENEILNCLIWTNY